MLHVFYFPFRWGPFVHSLGIVQWNSTRRDHPGNPGGVSGSGPVRLCWKLSIKLYVGMYETGNSHGIRFHQEEPM